MHKWNYTKWFFKKTSSLNARRKELGLTFKELARLSGLSTQCVHAIVSQQVIPKSRRNSKMRLISNALRNCLEGKVQYTPKHRAVQASVRRFEDVYADIGEVKYLNALRVTLNVKVCDLAAEADINTSSLSMMLHGHRGMRRGYLKRCLEFLYNVQKGVMLLLPPYKVIRSALAAFPVNMIKLTEAQKELSELRSLSDCHAQNYDTVHSLSGHSDPAASYAEQIIMTEQRIERLEAKTIPILEARSIIKNMHGDNGRIMLLIMEQYEFTGGGRGKKRLTDIAIHVRRNYDYIRDLERRLLKICGECIAKHQRK